MLFNFAKMDFDFSFERFDVMNFHDEADFGMEQQQMGGPPQDLVNKFLNRNFLVFVNED